MRHLEKWPFTSDALFSLWTVEMRTFSIRLKDKSAEQLEAESLSARDALEYLKVGGLDRVVAVKANGELQDLSTEIETEVELEPVYLASSVWGRSLISFI